jgi:hypothetical protein
VSIPIPGLRDPCGLLPAAHRVGIKDEQDPFTVYTVGDEPVVFVSGVERTAPLLGKPFPRSRSAGINAAEPDESPCLRETGYSADSREAAGITSEQSAVVIAERTGFYDERRQADATTALVGSV